MTVRSWTHEPIPMWEPKHKAWVRNADKIAEDNKRLNAIPFAATAPEGDVDIFLNQRIHHDIDKSGDMVRGLLTASQAMEQGMAQGYTRGILAGNQAHDRYVAGTMWGGKDLTKYKDTILEFDPEVEQFLRKEAGSSKWNLMKPIEGEIPILELMDETPEDMFSRPAPEGWKVEGEGGALDVLEKNDPDLYWAYKRELGGEEGLKKVTEGSRNPYEFFYNLSGAMQMNAMGKSLEVWQRQVSATEVGKEYAKSFVVSGILNDPDLLATMALSVGLSFFTFGTSLVGGAALVAARAGKSVRRIDRLSEAMGHISKWTRTGQRYLPENLGPTLIKSHLMKDSYAGFSSFGKYTANRLADTAEGLITEPLAEVMNQRRQIAHGTLDDYNIGSIVHEGLIGAAISGPLHLNFLVGKTYQVGGFGASIIALPLTVPATGLSKKGMLKTVNDFVGKTLRYGDPNYLLNVTKLTRASDEIKDILREGMGTSDVTNMESVTGDPLYDDMFNVLLNTLFEHGTMNEQQTMDALKGAAETIKLSRPEDWGKMDPAQFAALLSKAVVEQHGLEFTAKDGTYQTTLDKVLAWQQNHFWISEKARKEGMSFTEYAKKLKKEGNYFDILPDVLQQEVEERMGDTFESATHDQKYQTAVEVALELKQKKAEALKKPIDAIIEVNNQIDTVIREDATGDPVGSVEGATNPLDYSKAANEKIDNTKENINRRKKTLEQEQAADTKEPTSPKAKYKWTKRREKRARRIKKWEQAINKLEELRRDLDTELRGWLEVNNVDPAIVELHNTVKALKKNVDKSLEAVNKKGLTVIKELTDLNFILGAELDVLFKEILSDAEKEEVGTNWSLVRKLTNKRHIKTKDLSPKALETLNKINEHISEKSKLKTFIERVLNGEKERLTAGDVNQEIFGAVQKIIKKKKDDLYASGVWEFHKEEIRKYENELTDYKIKVAQIYKEQTSKEMRLFDAVYLQQNIAKWEKRQMRILEAKNDGLNYALDEWAAEGRSTIKLREFIALLHELSPFRKSMEENMSGLSQEEQQAILDKEYTRKEVKKIAAKEFQKAKSLIGKFRPGYNERMKFPVRSSYIKRTYVDQVSDSEIFSVDFSPEYIVEHSNPGTSLEAKPAEGTGALISVAGNEIQLNENTKIIMDEKGNPKVYYSAQNTILDRDAWDPDTDKEMQELTIAHEKARDAHERAVRDRDDGTRSTKVIQNEINELNNLAGDYSPALYQKKSEVENHSKILEDLTESLRYVVENESFDFTEADAKEIINKAKEVSRGNLTIQEFFKSFEGRELTNPIPHRVSDWLIGARELSKAGMGFKNNLTGETTTVEIVETKEAQKEREDKIRNLELEIWNRGEVIEGLRTEEFRARERMGQYFETRRVYQPIDWRSEGRTMGRTGDKRGGAFVTDKRHHAESYAGQKEGDTIAEIVVITQGDPIVIDMGGGIYNQDIEIEVLTKALPKDFIDWYIARYPNSPLAQEKTEGLSELGIDVLTSELSRWHREMKKAGEDTSNMANVVMFKNVIDWGDSTFMKPPEGSEFELADTVYVVNEKYIVDSDKAVAAPSEAEFALYTTAELMDKKVPEVKKIASDMKLATKLGITKTSLQKKRKRELVDLIISNQAAPAMAKAGFTRDLQSDVKNWNQFLANLEHFAGTEAGDNRAGVAAFRIFSNMPEYFWEMGLGVHIIFRDAIVSTPRDDGIENMNDVALGSIVHTLRFDMDKVVEIARNFRDRGLAYLEGWQSEGLSNVLDSLEEELMKEGDMSSAHNLFRTLDFLKGLEGALLPFADEMFKLRGYILTTDKDTGFPKPEHYIRKNFDVEGKELNRSEQDIQYTEAVRESIEKRLAWYVENNREGAVKDIAERFGIKADSKNWKEVAGTLGRVIVSRIGELESGWTITGFGNGTIGWDAADTVGMALVDFLAGKGMPGTQHLTSMEHRNGIVDIIGDENNLTSGEPVQVALPVEGDLNMAMPVPVWKLGALVNNYKHRNRVAYFLNKENFTEAELKALEDWRNNSTFIEDIDPTGEEFPVFIFPQFIGGHLQGTPMNRNDIKRIAFELMLDIPRISSSFIHDQIRVARGVPLSFRSGTVEMADGTTFEAAPYQNMLTHGDDFIVPFNRIGEIMAIEATSPKFEGLAKASIKAQERYLGKFREAWEAANPGKKWSVVESLSTANDSDRQASGIYEMKLLSLAGDDTSRITVGDKEYTPQELIQDIADGVLDSQFSAKEKDDYYVRIGIKIIQGSINNNVEGLGNIAKIFAIAQGADTLQKWNEVTEEKPKKVLKALREVFKVMGMRRIYGGGRPNFNLEFIQQIDGKGAQAIRKLEEASGLKISKAELNNLGHVVFTYGTVEHGKIMIDEALGMTGDVKAKALKYLSIEKKDQPLLEAWQDILDAQSLIEGRPKKELAKDVRELLSSVDTNRKLLDAKISQIAKYEGITREQVLKKRKYGERITEAKEYLQELEDRGIELKPGTDEWEVYTKILMPHDQLLATDLGYFRAVNIMNSSAYRLSLEKISEVAKDLNFLNFDTKDFLGLEKYVYYHQMLPTATSARAYDLTSSGGMNPQGMSLERVAREGDIVVGGVTYKGFDDYIKRRKEAWGDEWSETKFREELQEFLTVDDAADRFGMQELTDDQFTGMSKEEIEAELEQMLVRQEMITWASQDVPPPSVFPDYVAEDSDVRMLDSVLREWYAASEERHETLPQEMAREQEEWDKHGLSSELLKIKAKSGGLVNPEVAKASGGIFSYDPYNIAEQIELGTHSPERSLVVVDTSNPKGYRAMQPKYKKTPFHNKGILALQRKHVQEKIDKVMHPIDSITQQATEEGHGMVAWDGQRTHGVEVGWVAPWKRSSLPEPRNTMLNEFDLTGDQAGRDASVVMSQIHNWAKERGMEEQLKKDHRAYPYFFVIMEIEKARNEMILYGPRIRNKDEERAYRNRWLIKLHQISQLSRDIKGGSMKGRALEGDMALAIANPPREGMTWLEIMTSVVSEDNPYGIMVHPTLLHDALTFGAVPGENMITSFDIDGTSVLGDFDFNELQLEARAIQAQDFQKFLGSILYTEYIGKAMYDYEVDGEFIYRKNDLWKKPAAWELSVDFDHRIELINLAKQLVTENSQSLVLDVLIEEALFNDAGEVTQYKIIINQDQGTSERGKTIVTHVQRNALGDLGFGMLVGGNTKVKGKKATLGISPSAALNMFALLENARVFSRIGDAGRLNKAWGVKLSKDGRKIVAVPIQDAMKQALGFSARPIREAGIARSESLLRVAGDTMLETVTDPRSHILGRDVTVVDLDHYTESRHEGGQHMASAWVESYIAPVAKYITELENSGFQFEVQEGISELSAIENISETIVLLSKHVNAARQGEGTSLAIVMHLALLLENPGDVEMNSMVRRSFFDMEKFGGPDYNKTFEIAHSLFRKLAVLTSEDKYQRDTPWHAEAKNFFFERKGGEDPVDSFKNHLQETGQWEAADEYIRARAKEEGRVLRDRRRPDKIKIAKDPRQLLFDLGLEQDLPDFNEGWLHGDDVISVDIETDLKGHKNTPSFQDAKSIHTIRVKYKNDPTKTRTISSPDSTEVKDFLKELEEQQNKGYKVITFNGNDFDWNIMGRISGDNRLASRVISRAIDLRQVHMDVVGTKRGTLDVVASKYKADIEKPEVGGWIVHLLMTKLNNPEVEVTVADLQDFAFPPLNKDGTVNIEFRQQIKEEINLMNTTEEISTLQDRLDAYIESDVEANIRIFDKMREGNVALKATMNNHNYYGNSTRMLEDSLIETSDQGVEEPGDMEAERHEWAERAYYTAAGTEMSTAEVEAAMEFDPLNMESTGKLYKDSRTWDSMEKLAEKEDSGDLRRINHNIEDMVTRNFIDHRQARLIRALVLRSYRQNKSIVESLSFEMDARVDGPAGAFKQGTKYFVRFGSELKELGTDKLSVVQIVAHELSHIGRLKYIADNGGDWMKFESIYHSDAGRSLLRKLIQSWHNGRWTAQAEAEYNNHIKNPEEFIAALGQYYLLKDILPAVKDLDEQEMTVLDKAKAIVSKVFDYVQRSFRNVSSVWVTFQREDPKLMTEVNTLIDRLFGWDPIAQRELEVKTQNRNQQLNWMNRFEERGPVEYAINDGQYEQMIEEHEALLESKELGTPMSPEDTKRMNELAEMIQADDDEDYSMVAGSRRDYFRYKLSAFKRFGRKVGGKVQLDIEALLGAGGESSLSMDLNMESAAALHYLIAQQAETFGNAISRGGGELANKVTAWMSTMGGLRESKSGNGVRNIMVDLMAGQTGARYTWNAGHIIPIWMTSLLNDQIATVAGHYTNVYGTPSVQRVLDELAVHSQRVMADYRTIEGIMHPWMATLVGEGKVTEKQAERDMHDINTQIALKAEDAAHEFEFTGSTKNALDSLDTDKRKKVLTAMGDISNTFREFLKRHTEDGIRLGVYGKDFRGVIPYKLSQVNNRPDEASSFNDEMSGLIQKRITEEGPDGRIDPLTMFGSGLIPTLHDSDSLVKDLKNIKKSHPAYFEWLLDFILITEDYELLGDRPELSLRRAQFMRNFDKPDTRDHFVRKTRLGIRQLYQSMARENITWATFKKLGGDIMYSKYIEHANDPKGNSDRYDYLFAKGLHHFIPSYIAYNPKHSQVSMSAKEGINRPKDIHLYNLVNRARTGQYIPNDNWVIPKIQEAAKNETIRKHLILHPITLIEDFRKGIADEVGEKKMMSENYGIFGTYGDVISLFEKVVANPPRKLKNYDGSLMSGDTQRELVTSAQVLREKHEYIRGIIRHKENPNKFESMLLEAAPSVTKIAFGGNLMLATTLVESMMNVLQEGFGKGNLNAVVRGIFNPILALGENQREEVVNDLIHIVETLTRGYVPEYEKPAGHVEEAGMQKFLKGWGNQMMRPAQYMMKNIAITRAISVREFITKNIRNEKIGNLVDLIEKQPLEDPDSLADRMRQVGISSRAHEMTISYLLRGGFLEPGKYLALVEMLPKEGRYSPFAMYDSLSKEMSVSDKRYAARLEVIAGLKTLEKAYIEEIIVTPNAFDSYTGTSTMGTLWEIFTRYPVLFVAQHVFRKGSRLHPARYALGLISMMVLDMIYMNLLKVAGGAKIEDVLKDWEENPMKNAGHYSTRLPVLGRYGGIIAQLMENAITGKFGQMPGGFVSLGAVSNMLTGGVSATKGWVSNEDDKWQDTINFLRIVPMLGDSIIRMGIYAGLGDNINRRQYRNAAGGGGGGGSRGSGAGSAAGHYGVAYKDMYNTYESWLGDLVSELSPAEPLRWSDYEGNKQLKSMMPMVGQNRVQPQETAASPAGALASPVQAPVAKDTVGALLNQKTAEAPSGLLTGN